MRKEIEGVATIYRAVVHNGKVKPVYVKEARKRFRLTPDHGVSDKAFEQA